MCCLEHVNDDIRDLVREFGLEDRFSSDDFREKPSVKTHNRLNNILSWCGRDDSLINRCCPYGTRVFSSGGRTIIRPCGKCEVCKNRYASDLALRFNLDVRGRGYNWEKVFAVHLTITYNEDSVPTLEIPGVGTVKTLDSAEFTRFRKAVKEQLFRDFGSRLHFTEIWCGEYGEKTLRPHYHWLIVGLPYQIFDAVGMHKEGKDGFSNFSENVREWFADKWDKKGFVYATFPDPADSFSGVPSYVAKYVSKKVETSLPLEVMKNKNTRPFCRFTKGLGSCYFEKHKESIMADNFIKIHGFKYGLPRYFVRKYINSDYDLRLKNRVSLLNKDILALQKAKLLSCDFGMDTLLLAGICADIQSEIEHSRLILKSIVSQGYLSEVDIPRILYDPTTFSICSFDSNLFYRLCKSVENKPFLVPEMFIDPLECEIEYKCSLMRLSNLLCDMAALPGFLDFLDALRFKLDKAQQKGRAFRDTLLSKGKKGRL